MRISVQHHRTKLDFTFEQLLFSRLQDEQFSCRSVDAVRRIGLMLGNRKNDCRYAMSAIGITS